MSDTKPISRRDVVLGAGAAALAVSATSTLAEDKSQKDSPESGARRKSRKLHLTITLSDGSIVQLDACELTVDFGGNANLKLLPEGLLPVADGGSQHGNQRPNR
jgi:hypothetical protein